MRNLDQGYTVEVDKTTKEEWSQIIQNFDDATIYQTWEYGVNSWGEQRLGHLILGKNGQVIAAAQLRIQYNHFIMSGFAHVSWGPMWQLHANEMDLNILANVLRALRNEYTIKKKLLLRIRMNELDVENDNLKQVLKEEGFIFNRKQHQFRTIRLDLKPSLEKIRANFEKNWRYCLRKSEEKELNVSIITDNSDFNYLSEVYNEMVKRKQLTQHILDINLYKKIQEALPENLKMKIFLVKYKSEIMSYLALATLGNSAMPMIAASSSKGVELKLYPSYLLHWSIIVYLKENGFKYYDLRGYEPEKYPGVSHFKAGLSGQDVRFLGTYEAWENIISLFLVRFGEFIDISFQKIKSVIYFIKHRLL